jgi:polyphosphate kinase
MSKKHFIERDISWLSFNARVLQEANDHSVPLQQRIRFLGIFSNNLDEFFRVRVATLKRMIELSEKKKKPSVMIETDPQTILDEIQTIVLQQQREFHTIWEGMLREMRRHRVYMVNEQQLNKEQQKFVSGYFDEQVRGNVIPLMIEPLPELPYLREKSIYLGVVMSRKDGSVPHKYSLIEVPVSAVGRFILLPSKEGKHIILLEDIIRYNLPKIFSYFGYDQFESHIFKLTKDAELDMDSDVSTSFVQKMQKSVKNRRKGKPVRFVYDKEMDAGLLEYLIKRLGLSKKSNMMPGERIHNFRHFMDFPDVFINKTPRRKSFIHPAFQNSLRVTDVIIKKDVMLHFPYHSFNPLIDMLREAAMDPDVSSIKITAYRLAEDSKVINALINAARNGKSVTVMLELKARFDEEANLAWKDRLEDEGVKVLLGVPLMKIHAKVCVIKKRVGNRIQQYGFVSTGNLNERTSRVYGDHCLFTSNRNVMADINRIFKYLENYKLGTAPLQACKTLLVTPVAMRSEIETLIEREIKFAKAKKTASIIVKLNSLSDITLIKKLYDAATAGVHVQLIIRSIFCAIPDNKKFKKNIRAISIVDEYLEHARVMIFHNSGREKMYISSADWMVRNLDHRIEAAVPLINEGIKQELKDIIHIQLRDNVKARILDNGLSNNYVPSAGKRKIRSQVETHLYLQKKIANTVDTSGN